MLTRRSNHAQQKFIMLITGVALTAFSFWYSSAAISLGSTEQNIVKNSIAAEYQRYHLSRNDLTATQKASVLSAIQNLKIQSLSARGDTGHRLIVRVEVEPTEATPPGFANVLYYELIYSPLTGWSNQGRATAEEYYLSYIDQMQH